MAKEEALRKRAVVMYSDGKSVTEIARELGRSRQWVHKWIKRSKSKDGNGITDSAVRFGKEYSLPCFLQMDNVEARLLVNQNRLLIIQDEKVVLDFDFLMPSV